MRNSDLKPGTWQNRLRKSAFATLSIIVLVRVNRLARHGVFVRIEISPKYDPGPSSPTTTYRTHSEARAWGLALQRASAETRW